MSATPLRILYDRNLALGARLFPRLGRARAIDGRALTHADLAACDLLFVRSTCRLDAALLEGTPVRFVGSGVAGTDHIDFAALRALGIPVATAPGCNAESVADFVVAALLEGMQAGVGAVSASVVFDMGAGVVREKSAASDVIMALAFVAACFFDVNVVYIVLVCAAVGVVRTLWHKRKGRAQ